MKLLTEENINQLYKFTRQHFVYHYDVQTELVDHLANDIEQIWVAQPHLTFKQARDVSFKKFGVFGFMDVVEQKQKAMYKRYWKILWRFVKEWFTFPKAVITSLLFMILFMILQNKYAFEILLISFLCLSVYDIFLLIKYRKQRKKKPEKRWLLQDMIGETRSGFSFLTLVNIFNGINIFKLDFSTFPIYWIVLTSAISTLICIIFYVSYVVLPQKAEELLEETYPEYKML